MHHMWNAQYFGQEYTVRSEQTHFISLPSSGQKDSEKVWKMLDYADYDRMIDESERIGKITLNLAQHRRAGSLDLTMKVISAAPSVFEIQNFLSEIEVDHLIEMATIYNATEVDTDSGKKKKRKKYDSKTNSWIRREMSPIVDAIYHRSANILNIDEALLRHRNEHEHTELNTHHSIAEALHVTQLVTGQGYVPRSDSKSTSIKNRYQPNRFATIFFFLSDVDEEQDGDIVFPLAVNDLNHDGIRIRPKKGNAVLMYNMLPDGNVDDRSHHASPALQEGEKWMGLLQIWDPIID
jgi:prolyl 4-hydroxylase